jgi:hypothetical protein
VTMHVAIHVTMHVAISSDTGGCTFSNIGVQVTMHVAISSDTDGVHFQTSAASDDDSIQNLKGNPYDFWPFWHAPKSTNLNISISNPKDLLSN